MSRRMAPNALTGAPIGRTARRARGRSRSPRECLYEPLPGSTSAAHRRSQLLRNCSRSLLGGQPLGMDDHLVAAGELVGEADELLSLKPREQAGAQSRLGRLEGDVLGREAPVEI